MKYYKIISIIFLFLSVILNNAYTQTAPSFGSAKSFGVLAATTITNTGNTAIKGDIGVSPGAAITGFGPGTYTGTAYTGVGSLAGNAQVSANAVYADLVSQTTTTDLTGKILGVDVLTLSPGVYFFSSSAQLTGTLTLNDGGNPDAVFIFKISSTVTTASASQVVMSGGGNGVNVFWTCGTAATLGANTNFVGNIIASTSVSLTTGATNTGRLIALTGAVTLDANNAVSSQQNAFSLCEGGTAPVLSANLGTGIPYQWYSNTVNSNTGGTLIIGATLPTYTPDVSVAGIFYYYAIANGFSSDVTKVTVIANTAITSQPVGYSVCLGGTASSLSVSAIGAGLSYQWYINTTNSNSGGNIITGATSSTYIPDITAVGVKYYYVIASGTCSNATSNAATVTVNANTSITNQPVGFSVCEGGVGSSLSVNATGTGLSYQWFSNIINSNTGGTLIIGATSSSYTPNIAIAGVKYYYVVINGLCSVATSNTAVVTVNANTSITNQPLGFSVCVGGTSTAMTVSSTGTGLSYQWHSNIINSNTGGTLIIGATSPTYTPNVSVVGVYYYYVLVDGICFDPASNVATVTVNANTAITNQPQGFTICEGTVGSSISVIATGIGLSYQWYSNSINSVNGSTIIVGATSSTYTPDVSVAANKYYYVFVSGTCSNAISNTALVSVINANLINLSSAIGSDNQIVNVNQTIDNIIYNTVGSSDVKAIDLPNGVVGIWNNNVFTISGTPAKVGLFNYTIIITGGCKNTNIIQRGTITALPLPPIPIGGTYTSGAIGNPANINETVKIPPTGTKLLFCDISGNNCSINPPVLPFKIGVYIWCVKVIDTASGLISRPCKYDTVYIIPPPYSIDISKHVDTIKLLSDGKYLVRFKIKATNKMNVKLDSIQLRDDLSKIFPGGIRVLSVFATGNLIQNHLHDGISVIDLVTPESSLSANSSDSILLSIIINGTVPPGTYQNSVIMGGKTIYGKGQLVSNDYFANPNNPSIRMPAKFVIAKQDLIIPGGFSPNTDGIDDRYHITHPITTKIQLQVYNRWGNLVYKSDNYKNDWDGVGQGNFLGQNVPPGTYYYVVIAVDLNNGVKNFAGPLTIVRQKY